MLFFLLCALLTLLVAAAVLTPLLRPGQTEVHGRSDVETYRAQLAEVERDLARGTLNETEAEQTRTEIARRLLAADRAGRQGEVEREAPRFPSRAAALLCAALLVLGAGGTYYALGAFGAAGPYRDLPRATRLAMAEQRRAERPSQQEAEAAAPAPSGESGLSEAHKALLERLRNVVPTRPEDAEGWRLLARQEALVGDYVAARKAQQHLVDLEGDAATLDQRVRLADLMVAAANGIVTPQAEDQLRRILGADPDNIAARYYFGLLHAQTDRPDLAFRIWREVIAEGSPDMPHVRFARGQIEDAAFLAGVDYTLPEATGGAAPGPSAADMEAAADMDPEQREEMISGMVSGLAQRLANEGGPASDWARLIRAYGVLGQPDKARPIVEEARRAFAGEEQALARIEAAAEEAGIE